MVRVVFLVSPFRRRMVERMISEFTPQMVTKIVTPSYPSVSAVEGGKSFTAKVDDQFFGGKPIRDAIAMFEPEIIYCDNPLYASQFKLFSLLRGRRIPLVLHLRGDFWREYWAWFSMAGWRKRPGVIPQYIYSWASVCLAKKITPTCEWLNRVVINHVPWKRTEVVYQGVDPNEFFPERGISLQRPAVTLIQNHTIYPKVLGLLKFSRVVERLPRVHFYISEGERVAQRYLPLVKEYYSGFKNVHFLSNVDTVMNTRRVLSASDCYVLASGLDCCPSTVLEASLTAKPVIASRIGGVPEIVLEGETGWTIRNELVDEWVDKITLVLEDSKLSQRLGMRGREWVTERFGLRKVATQVEHLISVEAESG
jgi:glycosyltransferase involved in cell wall biosynthesis